MATLKAFRVDSKAVETGEWVRAGDEYDDLEILCRGFTDQYNDSHQSALRKAAKSVGGDTRLLPLAVSRGILIEKLIQHVILDVRNLADDQGNPVNMAQFAAYLRDPDYSDLVTACIKSAAKVGQAKADDLADASGNSAPLSA